MIDLGEVAGLLVDRAMEIFMDDGYPLSGHEQDELYDRFEEILELMIQRDPVENLVEDDAG